MRCQVETIVRARFHAVLMVTALLALAGCNSLSDATLDDRADAGSDVAVDATADGALDVDSDDASDDASPIDVDADVDAEADTPDVADEPNACGGDSALTLDGAAATVGGECGACGGGAIICNGPNSVRCVRAAERNVCGGCELLDGVPGDACGPCGQGSWQCDGDGGLVCEGAVGRNLCGGCDELEGRPASLCESDDGREGRWVCDGDSAVVCRPGAANACGGAEEELTFEGEAASVGDACGPCGDGVLVCGGIDALVCASARERNGCGGCGLLPGTPGSACGACDGTWACVGEDSLNCEGSSLNACGGCSELSRAPGTRCSGGVRICSSPDEVVCLPSGSRENACGGEDELSAPPGAPCGTCNAGVWTCDGFESVACTGDPGADGFNACGGCAELRAPPDTRCGTCGTGSWTCAADGESVTCEGDLGDTARNACGACGDLDGEPGDDCGLCATLACRGDRLECAPDPDATDCDVPKLTCEDIGCAALHRGCEESDGERDARCGDCVDGFEEDVADGVCIPVEPCGDGVVGEGEECDDGEANSDTEPDACRTDCTAAGCGDGVIDEGELCDGDALGGRTCGDGGFDGGTLACAETCNAFDYTACEGDCGIGAADRDRDGVPDACDPCPSDNPDDTDGDSVCDSDDVCEGSDDTLDGDDDGVPDACDICPAADDGEDGDGDGIPDACDICAGGDDAVDRDRDGVPDACDLCPLDNPDDTDEDGVCDSDDVCVAADDSEDDDGDGVPDECDICSAGDDAADDDADGVPDACDLCPEGDDEMDGDADGVPDACDICPEGDDATDRDADGVPDACDPCPLDSPDDTDEDGTCDSDDICPDNPSFDVDANACGGCASLVAEPMEACGIDGRYECSGTNAVRCVDVLGAPCDRAGDCDSGNCSASGFCAPTVEPSGFSYIPSGSFTMGSPPDELVHEDDETQHEVELTRAYYLQRTEVTQAQWRALMGNNPSEFTACGDDCPVEMVNWWEAVGYVNALSRSEGLMECYTLSGCTGTFGVDAECTGLTVNAAGGNPYDCEGYRLPTESEWEYACRAGTTTAFYNGEIDDELVDSDLDVIGWYSNNSGGTTHPVGEKVPNDWGLYDMLGNVWEWTWDGYRAYPPGAVTDPLGTSAGGYRVLRGGSWIYIARSVRSATRNYSAPAYRSNGLGFRPARTAWPAHCTDDERSGDEEGVDCGGSCAPCPLELAVGESCAANFDCASGHCSASGFCAPSTEPAGFSYIPAGSFTMGSPPDELGRDDDETQHEVTLTRGFFLQQTEVTQGQWQSLMDTTPSTFSTCGDDCPVENLNWWDAVGYANALSRNEGLDECYLLTGCDAPFGEGPNCTGVIVNAPDGNSYDCEGYRLPTESEWEYAYRAGTTTAFHEGDIAETGSSPIDRNLDAIGWYGGNSSGTTHPVGEKEPNGWGLFDVSGNVWEWTWDWHGEYPLGPVTDPTGPSTGTSRGLRGGSWGAAARGCRAADRFGVAPGLRNGARGFRPAKTAWPVHCADDVLSADEENVDCGGSCAPCPPALADGTPCGTAFDCDSGYCSASGFCAPAREPDGFSYIPPGVFTMGSPPDELGREDDETQHDVELTRGFFLQQTEVTQGQWRALMGNNPSNFDDCGADCPVERVSWWDALAYLNELSRREGLEECYELSGCGGAVGGGCDIGEVFCVGSYECESVRFVGLGCEGYRLPTESEGEYACRSGTTTAFYNGDVDDLEVDSDLDVIGWYGNNSDSTTHPVGAKAANAWGLYDMLGNAYEWTWDWYGAYPSGAVTDPLGASTGSDRVYRGGSWSSIARYARSASRNRFAPSYRNSDLGFRAARTAE